MTDTKKPGEDLAEDILGFGRQEVVTVRDLLVKPSQVLAAWMEQGAEGGGRYARPLRLYLALNAILMLLLFLRGGAGLMLDGIPDDVMGKLLSGPVPSMRDTLPVRYALVRPSVWMTTRARGLVLV